MDENFAQLGDVMVLSIKFVLHAIPQEKNHLLQKNLNYNKLNCLFGKISLFLLILPSFEKTIFAFCVKPYFLIISQNFDFAYLTAPEWSTILNG